MAYKDEHKHKDEEEINPELADAIGEDEGDFEDEDDEDDFFSESSMLSDELSHFNLDDIQRSPSVELSTYETFILSMYALWTIQSSQAKQTYKNFTNWLSSYYE